MEKPFLTLTFPRTLDAVKKNSHHVTVNHLNDEELLGYEFIKSKDIVTRKEYQKYFGWSSDKKVERHLRKMYDLKLIERDRGHLPIMKLSRHKSRQCVGIVDRMQPMPTYPDMDF